VSDRSCAGFFLVAMSPPEFRSPCGYPRRRPAN
jgi:hypothetical protein